MDGEEAYPSEEDYRYRRFNSAWNNWFILVNAKSQNADSVYIISWTKERQPF
jgi:hypothetical protein